MAMFIRKTQSPLQPVLLKILIHVFLLFLLWLILVFVVIPWHVGPHIPAHAYELVEGQKAYAKVIREVRPTVVQTIRGLNMAKSEYNITPLADGRSISFGNICMFFDKQGEFKRLEILKEAPPVAQSAAPASQAPVNTP